MDESVAGVVVTYNRKELLCECLEALLRQTRPLDAVFVIDNASIDGTQELLAERGILNESRIHYHRMPQNTGGAGGFHEGVKLAFEAGYDWFWLMDDDVEPYPDGLENLLLYKEQSKCIHGRRINPDGTPFAWGDIFDPRTVTTVPIDDQLFLLSSKPKIINVGCFEGMLIHREIVAHIGYPAPDFFIGLDDTLYGYLASARTSVFYVNVMVLKRKRTTEVFSSRIFGTRSFERISLLGLYFINRNRFLIARKLASPRFSFACASLRIAVRSSFREAVILHHPAGAKAVLRGIWDGALWRSSRC